MKDDSIGTLFCHLVSNVHDIKWRSDCCWLCSRVNF